MAPDFPTRRDFIVQAAVGLTAMARAGSEAFVMSTSAGEGISLLDALSDAERADVLAGANRIDITAKIRNLIARAPAGAVIDATMLRGTVRLIGNVFDGLPIAPVTFRTGTVTFRKDFNAGALTLPSHFHWQGEGTEIRPLVPLRTIPSDNSVAFAMVETYVNPGHCSGTGGARTIEAHNAAYTSGLRPGALIAIFGLHPDPDIQHTIRGALSAGTPSFTFYESVEGTIENSLVHLLVGDEIMQGLVTRGVFNTAAGGARGAIGTVARAHADRSTATLLRSAIFTVTGISGTSVTLDRPLPRTFVNAGFRAGSVGTRISGPFRIDGEFDRRNPGSLFQCLASTLGADFRAEGLTLQRGMHGGFIGQACRNASLDIDEISGCGRPAQQLGASIWLFGSAERNRIKARRVTDGYCGYVIDNKSNGAAYYGLDGPCRDNSIEIEILEGHEVEGQISGSSNNTVLIRYADTASQASIIDHGVSQASSPVATAGNTVTVLRQRTRRGSTGDALGENRIIVEGAIQR